MAAKVTAGLTASEAGQQALIEFGAREHARVMRSAGPWLMDGRYRTRCALRAAMLRKSPSFTCAMCNMRVGRRTLPTQSFTAAITV
jgi:hypothetical protein